jgi:hypothetical protein
MDANVTYLKYLLKTQNSSLGVLAQGKLCGLASFESSGCRVLFNPLLDMGKKCSNDKSWLCIYLELELEVEER